MIIAERKARSVLFSALKFFWLGSWQADRYVIKKGRHFLHSHFLLHHNHTQSSLVLS